jgi:acyl-CoA synthetase (AMP-forming)/AMP-acid ligase II
VAHQINDAGADLMFVDPSLLATFEQSRSHLKKAFPNSRVVLLCQPHEKPAGVPYKALAEVLASAPLATAERFDGPDCMATMWMSYSSGTTGLPKGVMTSHWNMTSQLQASNVTYEKLESGKDVVLGFLPFSHIYGCTLSLFQPMSFGVPVIVLPRFEETSVLTAIEKVSCHRC